MTSTELQPIERYTSGAAQQPWQCDSPICIDIETYWDKDVGFSAGHCIWEYVLNPHFYVTAIFAKDINGSHAVAVFPPPEDLSQQFLTHRQQVVAFLETIGYHRAPVVLAHNGAFDFPALAHVTGMIPKHMYCTLLGDTYLNGAIERVTSSERKFRSSMSLESVYQTVIGNGDEPFEEKDRTALLETKGQHPFHVKSHELAEFIKYGESDVDKCFTIFDAQRYVIPAIRKYAIDWSLRQMSWPRLQFDADKAEEVFEGATAQMRVELKNLGITEDQIRSAQKFHTLMQTYYEPAGLPWPVDQKADKDGNIKYNPLFSKSDPRWQDILLSVKTPDTVKQIMEIKSQVTQASRDKRIIRYCAISRMLNGFLPIHVVPSGAHTHRLTGGAGSGGNPLNLPREGAVRKCLRAPDGWKLFVGDFTGIELRIARWVARSKLSMDLILEGKDLYIETAAAALNKNPLEVTKEERRIGKITELSAQFGVGKSRLASSTGQDEATAGRFINAFRHTRYPELPKVWNACEMILNAWCAGVVPEQHVVNQLNLPARTQIGKGFIIWPSGVTLTYPDMQMVGDKKTYSPRGTQRHNIYGPLLFENIVQSLANEVMWERQYRVERETDLDVPFQVYDELLALIPVDGYENQRAEHIRDIMRAPFGEYWPDGPPLDIDYDVVEIYGDAK